MKLRYGDFTLASRRTTQAMPMRDGRQILRTAGELLGQRPRPDDPIRLLGLGVSNTVTDDDRRQLLLPLTEMHSAER